MTYPVTYDLAERAEVEYALKRMLAERLQAGVKTPGSNSEYTYTAKALRKTLQTDGIEYFKPVRDIQDIHY